MAQLYPKTFPSGLSVLTGVVSDRNRGLQVHILTTARPFLYNGPFGLMPCYAVSCDTVSTGIAVLAEAL